MRAQLLQQNFFELVDIDFSPLWLALYWSDECDQAGAGGAREIEKQNEMRCAARTKNELRKRGRNG